MLGNLFNYAAGAASIISLVIALTPYFPEYKIYFRYSMVFFFGALLGSLFASMSSQAIVIPFAGSVLQITLLIAAMISLAIIVAIILGIALGGEATEALKLAAGSAGGLFCVMIGLYAVTNLASMGYGGQRDVDESRALARYYKALGPVSRSMQYYCDAMRAAMYGRRQREVTQEADAICSTQASP